MSGLDQFEAAYGTEFPFHDENIRMLDWVGNRIVERIRHHGQRRLASFGIGHVVVCSKLIELLSPHLETYTIYEGSEGRIAELESRRRLPANVRLVHTFFEEIRDETRYDAVELGFVLEHVDDPAQLLQIARGLAAPEARLYVSVPNAQSLHRRLGHEAGLLEDMYRLSDADLALGHQRYFDVSTFTGLLEQSRLKPELVEGVYLKPFTTAQLLSLKLPPAVYDAFCKVAVGYPDLANSIFVEASLA